LLTPLPYEPTGSSLPDTNKTGRFFCIFDRCAGSIIHLPYNSTETDNKNFYIQTIGCRMGNLKGTVMSCNYDSYDHIVNYMGDENAIVVVIDE